MTRPMNLHPARFLQTNSIAYDISPISICFGENSSVVAFLFSTGDIVVHKDYTASYTLSVNIGDAVVYRSIIYSIALSSYIVFFTKDNLLYLHVVNTKYTALVSSFSSFLDTSELPDSPQTMSVPSFYSSYKPNMVGKTTTYPILLSQSPLYLYIASCWAIPIVFLNTNDAPNYPVLNRYYFQCFSIDIHTLTKPTPLRNDQDLHAIQSIKSDGLSIHMVHDSTPTLKFIDTDKYTNTYHYLDVNNSEPLLPFNTNINEESIYPSSISHRTNCFPENTRAVIASDYCYWSGYPKHVWLLNDGTILEADESIFALSFTSRQGSVVTSTDMCINYGPLPWQTSFSIPITISCMPITPIFSVENASLKLKTSNLRMLYNGSLVSEINGINISPNLPFTFELSGYTPHSVYSLEAKFELTGSFFKHY